MNFSKNLIQLRKENNLSQEELAEKIGVSRQTIGKWETGNAVPDIENLIEISNFFKVNIDTLVKPDSNYSLNLFSPQSNIEYKLIINFLIKAKKNTYAAKGNETNPSRPNSHDLIFEADNLKYIDSYLGGEKFAGEEGLWVNNYPIWSMNYCGRIIGEGFNGDFLKEALLLVPKDYPFRGPKIYQNNNFTYHCIISGNFEWFQGYEEIFYKENKVYECFFHGGIIK